jgi:hypothetical protein
MPSVFTDLKVAAYEWFGTDVYIYHKALASTAVKRLPVYNKESVKCSVEDQVSRLVSMICFEGCTATNQDLGNSDLKNEIFLTKF